MVVAGAVTSSAWRFILSDNLPAYRVLSADAAMQRPLSAWLFHQSQLIAVPRPTTASLDECRKLPLGGAILDIRFPTERPLGFTDSSALALAAS
jgi:hypothetical protein